MALISLSGCLAVPWTPSARIAAANPAGQAGVTIIFVESPRDICSLTGLSRVADHFDACGVNTIYFDPLYDQYDPQGLADIICRVQHDLGHRVMLVGWSLGGAVALDGIDALATRGLSVDTLVLLDLYNLNAHRGLRVHPPNVGRMVLARSLSFGFPSGFRDPATYVIHTWNHLEVPTHPDTLEMLFAEAALLNSPQ
jgi:pimeloyl-ACP methyl ester carboxylesterase